jgi:predicted nucleic-acid-binding protein
LPLVVVVELVWVLRIAYKFQRPTIVGSLRHLLRSQGVTVEREANRIGCAPPIRIRNRGFVGLCDSRISTAW